MRQLLLALLCVLEFAATAEAQFRPPAQRTQRYSRAGELTGAASQFLGEYQMEAQNFNSVDNEIGNNLNSLMPQFGELQFTQTGPSNTVLQNRATALSKAAQPRRSQGQMSMGMGSGIGIGGAARPAGKPFSGVNTAPTLSPYLLLDEGIGGDAFDNYNTLVRPMLQQQQTNQQVQRQSMELNQRVQQLSARPAFEPRGDENVMPTGHRTMFGNTLQFYPQRQQR
ncbi:MAG: hypothetical protein ACRCT8_09895 [Lacipirellulaceae bacterium]